MAIVTFPDCGKGVIKDLLSSELPVGVWSDVRNFRFRNGFAEMWGGIDTLNTGVFSVPTFSGPFASGTSKYAVYLGSQSGFVYGTSQTNITKFVDGVSIASITFIGTTATLTTTAVHGRTTGDTVTVYAAFPTQYNVTGAITVTSTTTFTYTMATAPATNATILGAYSYNVAANFAANGRWTGGAFNGVFLANNKVDGLYYWNGDLTTKFRKMPLLATKADAARPFKEFIVSLIRPYTVSWSASADPGSIPTSFVASTTNDAGTVELPETSGLVVDCLPLGDTNIIYKQDSRIAMRFIGGNDVFSFTRLPGSDGLLAPNCVVDTPVGHVFLTNDLDVMVHSGGAARSIAVGRIKAWIASSMKSFTVTQNVAFLAANPDKSEVWVAIPCGIGATYCTKAAVWNWESDTWSIFDFTYIDTIEIAHASPCLMEPSTYPGGSAAKQVLFVSAANSAGTLTYIGLNVELGGYFGAAVQGTLERTGLDFGDRNVVKAIQRSRWNMDSTVGKTSLIYHGSSMSPMVAPTYSTFTLFTVGTTNFVNNRAPMGRFGAIKLETNISYPCKIRSIDMDAMMGGTR